ncbi:glycoside hydrolase family 15 protein [Kribbella sp. NPDC050470]|uniref:glycoside hydrolase family 15 protein n=1 Tax=unclassified Kribbella TaxID=2644121 RepID=UPI00378D0D86
MSSTPIAHHAMLSDRHTAAVVDSAGSVEWLCLPRYDSPSVFGRLLDADAGHWSIKPTAAFSVSRRYLATSLVLETTVVTAAGTVTLTDLLCLGQDNGGHRLGTDVPHLLVRRVSCTAGSVDIELEYRPRPGYALAPATLRMVAGGVSARRGDEEVFLSCPLPLEVVADVARGRTRLFAGESMLFGVQHRFAHDPEARVWSQAELADGMRRTVAAWRSWSELHQTYDGPWADLVHHSGRVLQGLSYQPSGAIVAAPTTSLPEEIGGRRNWDYRYCWVRDASLTLDALWVAACPDEALDFFTFISGAAAHSAGEFLDLQVMFGVGGERELVERELAHLHGWCGSRPVRVGNGAWNQSQLDIYGELLAAAHRLRDRLVLTPGIAGFLVACADTAARRWPERDHGIWEMRGPRQHFLYSKVMCWVALDRAIALADLLEAGHRVEDWARSRAAIRRLVLRDGWSDELGAFAGALDSTDLDASALMLAIVGFLPADDPRMLATIDAVERDLTDSRGLVYRYRATDGLAGDEGTFLLCTFWLAQALALSGQVERALTVFRRAVAYLNDVGLLAEEVDARTGELLGNFPQAFSHIGLINAAWAISQATVPTGSRAPYRASGRLR